MDNNLENYGITLNPKKHLIAHIRGNNSIVNLTCVATMKQAVLELDRAGLSGGAHDPAFLGPTVPRSGSGRALL